MNAENHGPEALLLTGLLFLTPSANALVMTSGCADAMFCDMEELLRGGSITIDDKRFDKFRDFRSEAQNNSQVPFPVDLPLAAIDIKVHSQQDWLGALGVPDEIGLAFDIDSGGSNIVLLDGGQSLLLGWTYDVTVLDPARSIIDNTLLFPGGLFQGSFIANLVDSPDGATLTAREELTPQGAPSALLRKVVQANDNGDPVSDHRDFAPLTQFSVFTVINGAGGNDLTGTNLSLDILVQSFSQNEVPEPATLALLGVAFAGLGLARRRR